MKQIGLLGWVKPEVTVVLLSVVLSLIAISGVVTIGKDAALYMTIAQQIDEQGLSALFGRFNWPWISLLIAYTHKATGIGYETAAYFYSVFFMAGLSLLTVLIVKKQNPRAVWWAVLLVLSVPVFNGFRYEIIRETGYWFFAILAVWAIQPAKELSWGKGALFQVAVVFAMLFRFEAAFLIAAGSLYSLLVCRKDGVKNIVTTQLKIGWLFVAGLLIGLLALSSVHPAKLSRVYYQISMLDPTSLYHSFMRTSDVFAREALLKWSYSDAPKMLLAGILFILVFRALTYIGIVSVFFVNKEFRQDTRQQISIFGMNATAAGFYFLVLFVFFIQLKFVNSRYMALLILLLLPLLATPVSRFFSERPNWAKVFVTVSVFVALSNVISTGDKKTHYLEAAQWVRDNTTLTQRIYYEDARIQYYAGRGYGSHMSGDIAGFSPSLKSRYDFFVVEQSKGLGADFFEPLGFELQAEYSSRKKTIYILTSNRGS